MTLRAALAAVAVLLVAPGLALGAPLPTPTAQAPAEPTAFEDLDPLESFGEEISVEVVGLQVWVADGKGRPVTGLVRDDFVLLQDGEPVEIVNFAVYEGAAEAAPGEPEDGPFRELAPLDLGGDDPVHLAILVDNWNMRPEDRARVFEGLREFLETRVRQADRVAILVHDRSLELVQGFTDDREELAGTLDRMEKVAPSAVALRSEQRRAIEGIENAYMAYFDGGRADPDLACQLGAGWGSMENAARQYAAAVQAHARVSAAATASAAGTLAGLPGHRVLLYVGAGMAQTAGIEVFQLLAEVCPSRSSELAFFQNDYDLTWLYQEVAARTNAAGVTLFALEAETPAMDLGLDQRHSPGSSSVSGTSEGGRAYGPSFRLSIPAQRQRALDAEGSLVLLARETGGQAFLNAPELTSDFERLDTALRNYYSLGFRPPEPGDGELHRLEVRLEGDLPYRVRHRQAYQDKPPEQRLAERVLGVAQLGGGPNPLAVRLEVGEAILVDGAYRVPVRLWVPLSKLTLVPGAEGGRLGRLLVVMTATGPKGELGPVRQKLVPVSVPAGEGNVAGDQLVEIDVDLAPGQHHVAVAVRDGLGGETSYLAQDFRVPGAAVATTTRPD